MELEQMPIWPFVITLLVTAVVFYSRAVNGNIWTLMVKGVFSNSANYQLIRDENAMENTFTGLLSLTFFFSLALCLYNMNAFYGLGLNAPPWLSYSIILVFLFGVYVVKAAFSYILLQIFNAMELFEEYLIAFMNINIILGVCLIPLNLLFVYNLNLDKSSILIFSLILWILAFVIRMIRLSGIAGKRGIKLQYIILYLCTLEIMPVVLLAETLSDFGIKII